MKQEIDLYGDWGAVARRSIEEIRRQELVEACLAVVAEEGHDAATTQRIAARAETSAGIVHHYFGDKASLLQAAMRAVRAPVAEAYRDRLTAGGIADGSGRAALSACIDAHLDPSILTVRRAAAWLQFTSRVAYVPDYARIHAAIRCRQIAALRRSLRSITADPGAAPAVALRLAIAIDGFWAECATREGGLMPGEARATIDAILSDSVL
jgi:AcrR family transcriptional regulator